MESHCGDVILSRSLLSVYKLYVEVTENVQDDDNVNGNGEKNRLALNTSTNNSNNNRSHGWRMCAHTLTHTSL